MATPERVDPPLVADEATMLLAWLDFHRDTLRRKASGLDAGKLATTLPPSTLSLGGLLKHMAYVEDNWFGVVMHGHEQVEPWAGADWDADPDWEFRSAAQDDPAELFRLFDEARAASDRLVERSLADAGLDTLSALESRHTGGRFSLRWVLVHLIEEYARHNGHADLIRESVDGATGA